MPYTVTATRQDEKMQSVRNSSLIALAKARVWESEGWRVMIATPDGRQHDIAQLDELTAFKPEKLTALSTILPADEAVSPKADTVDLAAADSPGFHIAEMHGPWPDGVHGPWRPHSQDTATVQTEELLSS
ncbi:hypothetical protein [Rhodopseudomonas palustris]|uniref:hypothetical protein n=1 Tax=Rhodopseudomonas palustris TaxID=1076 RepID=UPI0005A12C34|nr:hypothetical protein [Rhodopseudomonas palustris]